MQIAITGASGFLGRQIVPLLLERGVSLLLIGRRDSGERTVQGLPIVGYEALGRTAMPVDALLHLAVLNNDESAPLEDFVAVNADLAVKTCLDAREAGIPTFYFISSTHAVDATNTSPYAQSKRLAAERLRSIEGIDVQILYLPAVLGDRGAGKLKALNRLPSPLRTMALAVLQALRPVLDVRRLADRIMAVGPATSSRHIEIIANPQSRNPVFVGVKRALDIAMSLAVLVFLWWLMLIVWLLVRTQSVGPGIFAQERVGKGERVFTCYKFRTMYSSTPDMGTHEVSASAVTPIGHFLRRTKIDELPQVFNVLRNEMSFVGPRPCLPSQTALIEQRRQRGIFDITPGITGLAQVGRVDMSDPQRITECDYRYRQLQTLMLDIKIILATATGKGGGDRIDGSVTRTD